jgi:hypothetical protein
MNPTNDMNSYWFTNLSGFPPFMVSSRFCLLLNILPSYIAASSGIANISAALEKLFGDCDGHTLESSLNGRADVGGVSAGLCCALSIVGWGCPNI